MPSRGSARVGMCGNREKERRGKMNAATFALILLAVEGDGYCENHWAGTIFRYSECPPV